ncbi:SDR family oxidoreductase [Corynebacterium sp. H78]|uniref:SDR family oxidoreductase n=1 Tax=Corynebacterium sp. H78 TaxID=3133417 RepID=UPI0030AFA833
MKSVIVTGGGAGIGREIAHAFAADGWRVRICGRTEATLQETCATVSVEAPGAISWAVCDITDEQAVTDLFANAVADFGRIDAVVVNAGVPGTPAEFGDVSLDDFTTTLSINVTGSFLTAREAFRVMRSQQNGGRILVNCSIAAQVPRPHTASYAASKSALAGLTRVLSIDGRPHGINVTRVDIGNAATALLDSFGSTTGALQADGSVKEEPFLDAADAARSFVYAASLPASATVDELTITASGMPFLGRG